MLLDWKNQYHQNDYATQGSLYIHCNPYQITNDLIYICGEPRQCRDLRKGPWLKEKKKKPKGRFLTKKGSSPEQWKPKMGFWS